MNAKEEFLRVTDRAILKCAIITQENNYPWDDEDKERDIILPVNYTEEQYNEFLSKIDFNYNSGYGGQELFGTIWNNNGSWLDRGEYDGSEWWELHSYPEIPKELL